MSESSVQFHSGNDWISSAPPMDGFQGRRGGVGQNASIALVAAHYQPLITVPFGRYREEIEQNILAFGHQIL